MTQSHLPRTGRGVTEAVDTVSDGVNRSMACLFERRCGLFIFVASEQNEVTV